MAVDFLGNKNSLLDFIFQAVLSEVGGKKGIFLDLFSGTAAVSKRASQEGFKVFANDVLQTSKIFAEADLLMLPAKPFNKLINKFFIGIDKADVHNVIEEHLNNLAPIKGTIYKHYSPASALNCEFTRMYFTEKNASKIDAVRQKIEEWTPYLNKAEKSFLLKQLVKATNKISNTAGTYGCYLKKWKKSSLKPLHVSIEDISNLLTGKRENNKVYNMLANELVKKVTADIIYADPPYTKRQYAAYYHILETIIHGDDPKVEGSTGLRPWQHLSSDYCYKRKARTALDDLVKNSECSHFFLSYNEDGQIRHDDIIETLECYGTVKVIEKEYRRYKSSSLKHKGGLLKERLYHLKK